MAKVYEKKNKEGKVISYYVVAYIGDLDDGRPFQRKFTIKVSDLPPGTSNRADKRLKDAGIVLDKMIEDARKQYQEEHSTEDRSRITLAAFIEKRWRPVHVLNGKHRPSTISFYMNMSDGIIEYFGRSKKLCNIRGEDVKKFVNYLTAEAKTKNGVPISNTTAIRYYQTFRNIINYAMRMDYLSKDPCSKLESQDKPLKKSKKIDYLTIADKDKFMDALAKEPLYWQCMINMFLECGLRRGEAVGLQWGDIDAENLTLSISRNVTIDKDAPNKFSVGETKTEESENEVPLTERMLRMLMDLKREQIAKYQAFLTPSAFIFCREDNPYIPLYPTEPTRFMRKFVTKYGLPNLSPHDLRHTCATYALLGGADIKHTQRIMRHKDPGTTMLFYSAVTKEGQRSTVEGIESVLLKKA